MPAAIAFYEALGLEVEPYDANYAFVTGQGTMVCHLRLIDDLDVAANRSALYVQVGDADAVRALLGSVASASEMADMPWGMREFSVTDPSGNLMRVGHSLPHEHALDDPHDHPHDH